MHKWNHCKSTTISSQIGSDWYLPRSSEMLWNSGHLVKFGVKRPPANHWVQRGCYLASLQNIKRQVWIPRSSWSQKVISKVNVEFESWWNTLYFDLFSLIITATGKKKPPCLQKSWPANVHHFIPSPLDQRNYQRSRRSLASPPLGTAEFKRSWYVVHNDDFQRLILLSHLQDHLLWRMWPHGRLFHERKGPANGTQKKYNKHPLQKGY